MELEPNNSDHPHDEFERELRQAFARRPAPPSLKRRLIERRAFEKKRVTPVRHVFGSWQALAASMVLMAVLAGGAAWRNREERRKEDAARDQVLTALRITSRALNQMNSRLAAHNHVTQD